LENYYLLFQKEERNTLVRLKREQGVRTADSVSALRTIGIDRITRPNGDSISEPCRSPRVRDVLIADTVSDKRTSPVGRDARVVLRRWLKARCTPYPTRLTRPMRARGASPDAAPHAFALVSAVPNALDTPATAYR
jgi:hypothetical protein